MTDARYYIDIGEPSFVSAQGRLQVVPVVVQLRDMPLIVHVAPKASLLVLPDLMVGSYCLIGYSYAFFESQVNEMLAVSNLSTIAGPYHNGTGLTAPGYVVVLIDKSALYPFDHSDATCVSCGVNISELAFVPCPNVSASHVHCRGEEREYEFECPVNSSVDWKCRYLVDPNNSYNSTACTVDISGTEIACVCEDDDGSRSVEVEFLALLRFTSKEFLSTWSSVQALNVESIKQQLGNVLLYLVLIGVLGGAVWCIDTVYSKSITARRSKQKHYYISLIEKFTNVDSVFPDMINDNDLVELFISELKKSHKWLSPCFHHEDASSSQSWRLLSLCTSVNCVVFFNALLLRWIHPDETHCTSSLSRQECLEEVSLYAADETMCYWGFDDSSQNLSCHYRKIASKEHMIFIVVCHS